MGIPLLIWKNYPVGLTKLSAYCYVLPYRLKEWQHYLCSFAFSKGKAQLEAGNRLKNSYTVKRISN